MKILDGVHLGYDDVALYPTEMSWISSREDVNIRQNWDYTPYQLGCPIFASPMADVTNPEICNLLSKEGGMGFLHRFNTIAEQAEAFTLTSQAGAAIGINGDFIERYGELRDFGCDMFILDVANGASKDVEIAIDKLLNYDNMGQFIVGNVGSPEQYERLATLPNVHGIRLCYAVGKGCSTKNATGIISAPITLISECRKLKEQYNFSSKIIADGGIYEPSCYCKAIAAGADVVMFGQQIADVSESPADLIKIPINGHGESKLYKVYHGSASFEIQKKYKDTPKYIEGKTRLLEFHNESLSGFVARYNEGLRSCMSYFNSKTLDEFRNKATFIRVTK